MNPVDGITVNDETRGMNRAKKAGHHTESYRTSWGEEVKGLTKTRDGRWRIPDDDA